MEPGSQRQRLLSKAAVVGVVIELFEAQRVATDGSADAVMGHRHDAEQPSCSGASLCQGHDFRLRTRARGTAAPAASRGGGASAGCVVVRGDLSYGQSRQGRSGGLRRVSRLSTSDRLPCALVGEVSAVDDVGQLPLERTEGFHVALALGELAVVVDAARATQTDLGSGGDVDDLVQLAVAAAGLHLHRGAIWGDTSCHGGQYPSLGRLTRKTVPGHRGPVPFTSGAARQVTKKPPCCYGRPRPSDRARTITVVVLLQRRLGVMTADG
jgi:hypothetical protein